jgi:hypothetical protein
MTLSEFLKEDPEIGGHLNKKAQQMLAMDEHPFLPIVADRSGRKARFAFDRRQDFCLVTGTWRGLEFVPGPVEATEEHIQDLRLLADEEAMAMTLLEAVGPIEG